MSIRPAALGLMPAVLALSIVALAGRASGENAKPQPSWPATVQFPTSSSGPKSGASSSHGNAVSASTDQRRLPEDSVTRHTLSVNGRTFAFTATAGSLRLFNEKGEPQADIAYTAYHLDGADPRSRPLTFFFNGGPGASSAYLQLG